MSSRLPFPAHQGTDPYLFASYAHADSEVVYPEMEWLHGLGHRIWYDEGIEGGSDWTESIAEAIDNCAQFLVFMSPQAAQSVHVKEEIYHAFETKKKLLCVHLQKTELSAGLKMRLGPFQAIFRHELSEEDYRRKLRQALLPESRSAAGTQQQVPAPPKPSAAAADPAQPARPIRTAPASPPKPTVRLEVPEVFAPERTTPPTRKAGDAMTGPHGIELVWCPPGTFTMGSPPQEKDREGGDAKETQHHVTLTKGFWIGKHPVTQQQWEAVMGSNPSNFKGPQLPVEQVSWNDAQEFLKKLGAGYRLPTEAEWEYACRAGTTTPFSFGSQLNGKQANCDGNYPYGTNEKGPYLKRTSPVGSYPASPWGIHDMHGNVWEWCADWYQKDLGSAAVTDPTGPPSGSRRVDRGGSWNLDARYCRSANRLRDLPGYRSNFQGFRVLAVSIPSSPGSK